MKKIALFSLLVCMGIVDAGFAGVVKGADCKREFSPKNNNWFAVSNEYLFPTEKDYNKAINRGVVYECDDDQCPDGSYVTMPAGHYFNGFYKDYEANYRCNTKSLDDYWEKVTDVSGLKKCTKGYQKWGLVGADSDEYLYPSKEDYDAVTKSEYGLVYECDSNVCPQGTEVVLDAGHYFGKEYQNETKRYVCVTKGGGDFWMPMEGLCNEGNCGGDDKPLIGENCQQWKNKPDLYKCCMDSLKADAVVTFNNGFCECKDKETKKWNPNTGKCEDTQKTKTCKESRTTAEGKACCDLPASEAKWENNKCNCLNGKEFKMENGRGQCVDKNGPVAPVDPDEESECWYTFGADMKCANGNSYTGVKRYPLNAADLNGMTCDQFKTLYAADSAKVLELFKKFCETQGTTYIIVNNTPSGPNAAEVSNAKGSLDKFFASAESEASVWKDSEGKFNTARLASDLTAGVVLGTVGGVVSGVVIKKKQVEKGFEVLHCAVGGQKIADWGDEFSVGLR